MNDFEKIVDRLLRKVAWKTMTYNNHKIYTGTIDKDIKQYRWIIKDAEDNVLYDSDEDDYKGLYEYPVVYESLDMISDVRKTEEKRKINKRERTSVVFHIDSNLWTIFPSEAVESMCVV
ncbi:MAG: hypothetical protein K6E53_15270 [Lachnospiraceae bacterium]|nr:hypothetical protein [Lachnospiraceae bacterium]